MKAINFHPVYDENKIGEYLVRVSCVRYLDNRYETPTISIPVFDNRKCDVNIVSILKCCDPVQKAFVLGGITATITAKVIAEIFRLPNEGEEINLNSRRRKNVKDISKKILEERILRVVKMHGSVHEGDLCDWFVYIFA
ncbi:hypothetical protein ACFX1T_043200 [Malus domestica]